MTDDELIDRLRAVAAELDPLPADVLASASAAFALRTLDEELAELVADSLDTLAATRGPSAVRLLSFQSGTFALELEVSDDAGRRTLLGEVTGAEGSVLVETPAGSREVGIDADGRFTVEDVPSGPVRLRCTAVGGTAITTVWTRI
jgi:hypothetical protein